MNRPVLTVEYHAFVLWLRRLAESVNEVRLPPQQFDYARRRMPDWLRWVHLNDDRPHFILFGCKFTRATQ